MSPTIFFGHEHFDSSLDLIRNSKHIVSPPLDPNDATSLDKFHIIF